MKLLNIGLFIIMFALFGLQMYCFAQIFASWGWVESMHPPRSIVMLLVMIVSGLVVVVLTRRARRPR